MRLVAGPRQGRSSDFRGLLAAWEAPDCLVPPSRKSSSDVVRDTAKTAVLCHSFHGPESASKSRKSQLSEVQISIKAIGLNRAESMFRSGQYLEDPKLPAKLGYEAAGTVAAIGPGVNGRHPPQQRRVA